VFRIIFLITMILSQIFASSLTKLYQLEGIDAVEVELEKQLQDKKYWQESLKDKDLTLGYYEKEPLIVLINKEKKTLKLFDLATSAQEPLFEHEVITGLMGDKQKEGDLKTPIGVYDLLKRFVPQDQFYGQIAYALSYPNTFDKQQKKTGYGIWIHGHPLNNKPRYTQNTEGCVVMTNDKLELFDEDVKGKKAIAIIDEAQTPKVLSEDISALLAEIFKWRSSWKYSNLDRYLSFYHEDFRRFDGANLEEFKRMKRAIFSRNEDKKIIFKDISISPYPDEKYDSMYLLRYYQVYETKNHQFKGNKEIFLTFKDGKMKILVEN